MAMSKIAVLAACSFVAVQAHMQLGYPPPFQAGNNPHKTGEGDSTYNAPMGCCGYNNTAICRGYLDLLGTPAGASVATWKAGSTATFSLTGEPSAALNDLGDTHYGGSCQVGFSTDGGKTFRVAASYEGNCPHRKDSANSGQDFTFTVPQDMPDGDAVFAWTWINREQEFNMNCAAVTITDGTGAAGNNDAEQGAQQPAVPSVVSEPVYEPSSEPSYAASDPAAEAATTVARGVSSASHTPSNSQSSSGKYKLDWCQCTCDESTSTLNKEQAYDASGCTCQCWKAPTTTTSSKREVHMARHVHNRRGFADNKVIKGDGEYPMKQPSTAQCTSNTSDD
ncbi:hypothetical protein IWX47DRAFT_240135 [Phyllosticta citricarpa]